MSSPHTHSTAAGTYTGPIFDCDTHIYESSYDFFKEYLPKEYHQDWLLERRDGPEGFGLYVGQRKAHNAEANPAGLIAPPGKLKEWLQAMKEGKSNVAGDMWIKPTPDMDQAAPRLATLDRQGVEGCIMFIGEFVATLGYYAQDKSGTSVLNAYNRYLHDRFKFNNQDRIYTTACLSLWDVEESVKEADWLIKNGVRVVVMPMGPAQGKSPVDPSFDPIYARLNEAGVAITYHVSEASFMHPLIQAFGEKPLQSRRTGQTAWQWQFCYSEIPVQMHLANMVFGNFFKRFPNIKVASVENGCEWLPSFLEKMDKMRGMAKNGYWPHGQLDERPSKIFKRHCWVVAYPEDDIKGVVERIGSSDCIVMGSDYPHAEGVPEPRDFFTEALTELPPETARAIMYDNGRRFMPAGA